MKGQRIKKARLSLFPSQSARLFGENIGVHEQSIRQWERGETFPKQAHLLKISELTGFSAQYLRGETDDPKIPVKEASRPATQADILALGDKFSEIGERLSAIMRECAEQLREIRKELNGRDKRNRTETHIYPHPL